jgi:hypothetical protein
LRVRILLRIYGFVETFVIGIAAKNRRLWGKFILASSIRMVHRKHVLALLPILTLTGAKELMN